MTAARFPGHAYDTQGEPLTADAPRLTQTVVDSYRVRSGVFIETPDDDDFKPTQIWILADGATYGDLPAIQVEQAAWALEHGGSVLLLTNDAAAATSVREGLYDQHELHETPGAGMGQA